MGTTLAQTLPPAPPHVQAWCDDVGPVPNAPAPPPVLPRVGDVPPLWLHPSPGCSDLYGGARGTLLAGGQLLLDPGYAVELGWKGVLKQLRATVTLPTAGMDVRVTVLKQGNQVRGWTRLRTIDTTGAAIVVPFDGPLHLVDNEPLTVLFEDIGGTGPYTVQADLFGWQWTRAQELALFGVIV